MAKGRSDNILYVVEQPQLTNLEDQPGKPVVLRGIVLKTNQYWWFNYRGIDLYVENLEEISGGDGWAQVSGILDQAKMPDIDQIGDKSKPDRKMYYIVRKLA